VSDTQPEGSGTSVPEASGEPVPVEATEERSDAPPAADGVIRGGAAAEGGDEEPVARVGQVLAGRYRIEKELGAGGMGSVYRAEHVHMRKAVAIKVLHREMTYLPEVVARFEREAVAAARIEHPHVAAATDFGRLDDGAFYLVLEYVEGKSLRDIIDSGGALPPGLALHVTRQIADALSAAHAAGIVHRDLKPDNVMLIQREGDEHFVKVLDFGIAKVETGDAQNQLTQLGSVFGTPEYMAPEQAAGTPVDARADLYTLGIILYEMLTGTTPFASDDLVVVLTQQMTAEPPPLPPGIDAGVAALTLHLLAKDPGARPQTAEELLAHIDAVAPSVASAPAIAPLTPSPTSVSVVSSRTGGEAEVAHAATVLSVPGSELARRATLESIAQPTTPSAIFGQLLEKLPVLQRPVNLGGQKVPLWALIVSGVGIAFLFVVVLGAVVATGVSSNSAAGDGSSSVREAKPPDPDTAELMKKARTGDRAAITKLQERPESERSAAEWRALGHGLAVIGHGAPSLQAYEKALTLDPGSAKDNAVIGDIHRAALNRATVNEALRLASTNLGSVGADLVYDIWSSTRSSKDKQDVSKIAKNLLDSSAVRSKASPALLVALDLAKAKGCAGFKELLPRARDFGDSRSVSKLKALSGRRGCGFLGLADCYSCLRRGTELQDALKSAESRSAPSFQ